MAYGKGRTGRDDAKRMADLGRIPSCGGLADLRSGVLKALGSMAAAIWPKDVLSPMPTGKELDAILLKVQSDCSKQGLNNVWAEKARLIAKSAVTGQWTRAQRNLYGRLKHVSARGEGPSKDGVFRLVNLPESFSKSLSIEDVATLQALADGLYFRGAMRLFADLAEGDANLSPLHAEALRAMADVARHRYGMPEWNADAVVQLHLDYRCIRGGKEALASALEGLRGALAAAKPQSFLLPLTSVAPRGAPTPVPIRLAQPIIDLLRDGRGWEDGTVRSLVLELGPDTARVAMVLVRPPVAKPVAGHFAVVAEDFGYLNTSSIAVLRSKTPIAQERVDFALARPGKGDSKTFLEAHVSGDETELVETVQFCGRDFLGRIRDHAARVDRLRSEIDLVYNRMARIRREMNFVAGLEADALVPAGLPAGMPARYADMHRRFFRRLAHVGRLKELRRGVYRAVAGLKKAWFGHVSTKKADLAEKHGAAVATEDLSVVAAPKDDPDYRGRTFNRMINNGSKGQYSRRSEDKLKWRGIPSVKVPSYWTSCTDWRDGTVDRKQRRGTSFAARSDGRVWDADLHAAEAIGRYLFLRPKRQALAAQ